MQWGTMYFKCTICAVLSSIPLTNQSASISLSKSLMPIFNWKADCSQLAGGSTTSCHHSTRYNATTNPHFISGFCDTKKHGVSLRGKRVRWFRELMYFLCTVVCQNSWLHSVCIDPQRRSSDTDNLLSTLSSTSWFYWLYKSLLVLTLLFREAVVKY